MPHFISLGAQKTRRQIRRALRQRKAAGRIGLVAVLLFGIIVSAVPTAQAVVALGTVNQTVNGGESATVDRGEKLNLKVAAPVADPGSLTQSITQFIDNSQLALTSSRDIIAPAGWELSYSYDGTTFTTTEPTSVAQWATVKAVKARGDVVSEGATPQGDQIASGDATGTFPAGGSFSPTGNTGDGFNLMFDERGRLYNIWHHNGDGYVAPGIDCHTRAGTRCEGNWPFRWNPTPTNNLPNTPTNSSGWYDSVDQEIWFNTNIRNSAGIMQTGFACLDISDSANPEWCGGTVATGFIPVNTNSECRFTTFNTLHHCTSGITQWNGRIFSVDAGSADLMCVDIRANFGKGEKCAGDSPSFDEWVTEALYSNVTNTTYYNLVEVESWNGKIYGNLHKYNAGAKFFCIDALTLQRCAGWESLIDGTDVERLYPAQHVFKLPDATGNVIGICFSAVGFETRCYREDGTKIVSDRIYLEGSTGASTLSSFINATNSNGWFISWISNIEISGTKIFIPGSDDIGCWDVALNNGAGGICPNWNGGRVVDNNYTVNVDPYNPTCIWTLDDPGEIKTWDTETATNSCTPRSIVFDAGVIVPRMGCDVNGAIKSWKSFSLTGPPENEYSAATLTITRDDGTAITGWSNISIPSGTRLVDLTALSVTETGQHPRFVVNFVNRTSGTSASATVKAVGDAPELCLTPTAIYCSPYVGIGPYGNHLVPPAATVRSRGEGDWSNGTSTTPLTADPGAPVTLLAGNPDYCAPRLSGKATRDTSSGAPIAGAIVSLLDNNNNPVTYPSDWPDVALRGQPVTTTTQADGTYTFNSVFSNTYRVRFADVPTAQVTNTNVVSGSTPTATKTTTDSAVATTSLTSVSAGLSIGTNGVVDAVYTSWPSLNKEFMPSTIGAGGHSRLVFTVTNATGNPAQSGRGFVDTLPSGLVVAEQPHRETNCPSGGATPTLNPTTMTALPGSSVISVTNFSLNAGTSSCWFAVNVTSENGGTYTNGSGNVTTTGLTPPNSTQLGVVDTVRSDAFTCLDPHLAYVIDGGQLEFVNTNTGLTGNIGPNSAVDPDAIGFNQLDGYIYGIASETSGSITKGDLVRIANDGTVTGIGAPLVNGVPTPLNDWAFAGTMDDNGRLLVIAEGWPGQNPSIPRLYSIDVRDRSTTVVTLSSSLATEDVIYKDGLLHSFRQQAYHTINPLTGAVSAAKTLSVSLLGPSYVTFALQSGDIFVRHSTNTAMYRVGNLSATSPTLTHAGFTVPLVSAGDADATTCQTVSPPPGTRPDISSSTPGSPQFVDPLANDFASDMGQGSTLSPQSVKLCADNEVSPNCTLTRKVVPGEGVYEVDPTTGRISFTPEAGFRGPATPQRYQVSDDQGNAADDTYTPIVVAPPTASPDATNGAYMATQSTTPMSNDTLGLGASAAGTTWDPISVRLCVGNDVAPECTGTSLTIIGQGTYSVNTLTGVISFTPVKGFTGTAIPVVYSVSDSLVQKASSTYTPTVNTAARLVKEFAPNDVAVGGVTVLKLTIQNITGNPAQSGLSFVDTLPDGVVVADNPALTTTCPGGATVAYNPASMTAVAGSNEVTISGASMSAGVASCVYTVNVKIASVGSYTNGANNVSSTTVLPPSSSTAKAVPPATPGGFTCTPYAYHFDAGSAGGRLYVQNPVSGESLWIGPVAGGNIQALGFNSQDGYIYGYVVAATSSPAIPAGNIVKFNSSGVLINVGQPTLNGSPLAAQTNTRGGDTDESGNLFLMSNFATATNVGFQINLSTLVATRVTLSANVSMGDLAFFDGKYYGVNGSTLTVITPVSGGGNWTVATRTISTPPVGNSGAVYANAGELLQYSITQPKLFRINGFTGTTPSATGLGLWDSANDTDGAMCHLAGSATMPSASPDTSVAMVGQAQVISPLTNDSAALGGASTLNPQSVKLCGPTQVAPNCNLTTLTTADGTYTVNSSGQVQFTPRQGFTGTASPVTYQVADSAGNVTTSTITPTVIGAPAASPDTSSGAYGASQTVDPLTNDAVGAAGAANNVTMDPTSVRLCASPDVAPNCTNTSVTIQGQGTYGVNPVTGEITFTPVSGFTGNPTPITYSVADNLGQKASTTYQPSVGLPPAPTARDNTSSGDFDVNQTINPVTNDVPGAAGITFVQNSVKLCGPSETAPNCTQTTLTINGEGTYTVNNDGTITFNPVATFTGTVSSPVRYSVTDSSGQKASASYTPTVNPPALSVAAPDSSSGPAGSPQRVNPLSNDSSASGVTLDPNSVRLCGVNPVETSPNCTKTSVTVNGGTYSIDPTTKEIIFTPNAGFSGTPGPVNYQVTDSVGRKISAPYQPEVIAPPTVVNDTSSGPWDTNQTIRPLVNDSAADGVTLVSQPQGICASGTAIASCTGTSVTTIDGVYTLNSDGSVTFDPAPSFTGTAQAPINYVAVDSLGQKVRGTITPSVDAAPAPQAQAQLKQVAPGAAVSFSPITNPIANSSDVSNGLAISGGPLFVPSATCLITPGSNPASCDADGIVVVAEGTYTLNANGTVSFAANLNAPAGVATPVAYRVTDVTGATATATLTPVIPAPPTATNDSASAQAGSTIVVSPLTNDSADTNTGLVPSSLKICPPTATTPADCSTSPVVVAGQGTYTLNTTTGEVTFVPEAGFTGTATPIKYVVSDAVGQTAMATITVTELPPPATTARNDAASGAFGEVILFDTLDNDSAGTTSPIPNGYQSVGTVTLNPQSVKLCGPGDVPGNTTLSTADDCNLTELVTPEGTYRVDPATGDISFTPATGFSGTPNSPPTYVVCNTVSSSGWSPSAPAASCSSATITPTVAAPQTLAAVDDRPSAGSYNTNQTINVLQNDTHDPLVTLDPNTVKLCATGQTAPNCTATTVTIPGEGTYTVNNDGTVTFDPEPSFSGTGTGVTYVVRSSSGQTSSAQVIPQVSAPAPPLVTPDTIAVGIGQSGAFETITGAQGLASGTGLQPSLTHLCGTNPLQTPPACDKTTVVVPGSGTYVLNQTTGVVTFTADNSTSDGNAVATAGTQPALTYVVTDITGQTASSILTPTIIGLPTAVNDSSAGAYNQNQIIDVIGNDTSDSTQLAPLDPTSVKLCSTGQTAPNCSASSVTIPGEGTYSVNPSTGAVTFDPIDGFTGNGTSVTYQVSDSLGQVNSAAISVAVTVFQAQAANDTPSGAYGVPLVFNPTTNDSGGTTTGLSGLYGSVGTAEIDPQTVRFCDIGETAPNCSLTQVTTPDGTYEVNLSSGDVTFTPTAGFTGTASTPVNYQVCNQLGGAWNPQPPTSCVEAEITPQVAAPFASVANPDSSTTPWDTTKTLSPLVNDTTDPQVALLPSTVKLCGSQQTPNNCNLTSLNVPGEGTYIVNSNGTVSFDPLPEFSGTTTAVTYQVRDELGSTVSSTMTVNVGLPAAPTATPERKVVSPGRATDFSRVIGQNALATGRDLQSGSTDGPCFIYNQTCVDTVTTAHGVWSIDQSSGVPSFTAFMNAPVGELAPITYRVTDVTGQTATSTLTPVIPTLPSAVADNASTPFNTPVTKNVITNDAPGSAGSLEITTIKLCAAGTNSGCQITSNGVTVDDDQGQPAGTYSVNTATGEITFTPTVTFRGVAPAVTYSVEDSFGRQVTTTFQPTVAAPPAPIARDDQTAGLRGAPQSINLLTNSSGSDSSGHHAVSLNPSSVVLCDPNCQSGSHSQTLTVENVGTYAVDSSGVMTFTPDSNFTGAAPAVPYQVTDTTGQVAIAFYTAVVVSQPSLVADTTSGAYNQPQTAAVLGNDVVDVSTTLDTSSLRLIDPGSNQPTTSPVTIDGQGTYSISGNSIVFTPESSFSGTATAITYQVADALGQIATTTYTPSVSPPTAPLATADTQAVLPGQTVEFDLILSGSTPLASGTGIVTSGSGRLCLIDLTNPNNCSSTFTTSEGVWTVTDPVAGKVTFTANSSGLSVGNLPPITYRVTDAVGQTATATLTPVIPPAPTANPDLSRGEQGKAQLISPLGNDRVGASAADFDVSSLKLCGTNETAPACSASSLVMPGEGTYSVNNNGTVSFQPELGFSGEATPIAYSVTDDTGQQTSSTITVEVIPPPSPTAIADYGTAAFNQPVNFKPWLNDLPGTKPSGAIEPDPKLVAAGIRLCETQESAPDCTATTLITDDGTYEVNVQTGSVLFTPISGFTGTVTQPVSYQISNDWTGASGPGFATSILVATIAAPGSPVAVDDVVETYPMNSVTIMPLANDVAGSSPLAPTSIRLCSYEEVVPQCTQTRVDINEGFFKVNTQTGEVLFVPNEFFNIDNPAYVTYVVQDAQGQVTSANITVNDPPLPAPINQAINLVRTGFDAAGPLPVAIIATVAGIGALYYSRQKLKPVADVAQLIALRERIMTSYEKPALDYSAIEKWIDSQHRQDFGNERPD